MSAIAARRTRRTTIALVSGLVVAVLVPVFGYVGANAILDSKGSAEERAARIPLPSTPAALHATVDEGDRLTSLTAFVLAEGGTGGSIVSIPVNADSNGGAGDERRSLQQVYESGGMDELVPAVESVLSVTFRFSQLDDAAGADRLLAPLAPIAVDLPADVVDTEGTADAVALTAGEHSLGAGSSAVVLTSDSTRVREATRRPGIDAFWQGVVAAIGDGRPGGGAPSTGSTDVPGDGKEASAPSSFGELVARLFAGPAQHRTLEVSAFDAAANPDGADVELLDRTFAVFVFAAAAPGAMSRPAPGYVYRVEAPAGYEAEVRAVIGSLLYLGANVSSVNIAATPQPDTVALVASEGIEPDPQILDGLFGDIRVQPIGTVIDTIDIELVLGTTFLDAARTNPPVPASTTTVADGAG